MARRNLVQIVEIDQPFCTREFGVGACGASLSLTSPRKCYNTFPTCSFRQAYNAGTNTLRFIEPTFQVKGELYFPCIKSIGGYDQEVNIAGFSPVLGGLGKRASVKIKMADFPYNDITTDKYWQQRVNGAAQIDEGGYRPLDRGSFWSKWKARNPNFAGRNLRVRDGYINSSGGVTFTKTRHYVISEVDGPDTSGDYTITAKDILALADDKRAMAPVAVRGRLSADITAGQASATLTPAGIGASDYPSSGWATIGSEIVSFTRSGNNLTLTRGRLGTQAAAHNVDDTVQVGYRVNNVRADVVIRDLLVNYAGIPTAWIPTSEWAAEMDRWGGTMILNAMICQPTSVAELLGEISQLGITLWWDELAQRVRLRMNRPSEVPAGVISDRNSIISIKRNDEDNQRATRVAFWSVQIDPTKGKAEDNFLRATVSIYVDAESPDFYGQPITKTIYSRWLNQGNDAAAKIITGRLLNRYKRAPVNYDITVDAKDDLKLLDVVNLESYASVDDTGRARSTLCQVFYRGDEKAGSRIKLKLQAFQFDSRYAYVAPNSMPTYNSATEAQKNRYGFIVGPSLQFDDGRGPYQLV